MSVQVKSLSHRRRILGGTYNKRVLKTWPIAYWPLNEGGGTNAACLVNPAQNGTAVGVTWANDNTGPFGTPAPYFDGANDYVNIYSAAFDAAFSGATGSALIWCKVANVGVWTDTASRKALILYSDADNNYWLEKNSVNNRARWGGAAGAGAALILKNAVSTTGWVCLAVTWSDGANADQFKAFWNGTQEGATSAALNNWGGVGLDNGTTNIGCLSNAVPSQPWHGWLAHAAVWDRALTQAEITALANP